MRYYIIAGEASGDLHGSNLIKAIKELDNDAEIRAWGGDLMQAAGAHLVRHYKKMAFMGFWEVIKNLFTIKKNLQDCKADILEFQPDALVLIDYAGFNMRVAAFAKQHQLKVFYYIAPKVWAWNQKRAYKLKRLVDQLYVILPFEKKFFQQYDLEAHYVGNPLLDAIRNFKPNPEFFNQNQLDPSKKIIAVLPGSRRQEINKMLDTMLHMDAVFEKFQFVVAGVSQLDPLLYSQLSAQKSIKLLFDQTYDLLSNAHAAIVTSGTATLETALFKVPQVVCYKTSKFSYLIGKQLIKVPFISLVNLIADKEVVRELIQDDFNAAQLSNELEQIVEGAKRDAVLAEYDDLIKLLGNENASLNVAKHIFSQIKG